jgi:hypothetical protein
MNQPNQFLKRNPGKFSFEDNKLRISSLDGISSVLFEDISSITYNKVSIPNMKWFLIGFITIVMGTFFSLIIQSGVLLGLILLVGFGMVIYTFYDKIEFDNILVETRGGKLINYTVELGEGENQVEEIEKLKREITQK